MYDGPMPLIWVCGVSLICHFQGLLGDSNQSIIINFMHTNTITQLHLLYDIRNILGKEIMKIFLTSNSYFINSFTLFI